MSRFELTRSMLAGIDELWTYIAEDNAEAAGVNPSGWVSACERNGHAQGTVRPAPCSARLRRVPMNPMMMATIGLGALD